jgi:hypothetical protein
MDQRQRERTDPPSSAVDTRAAVGLAAPAAKAARAGHGRDVVGRVYLGRATRRNHLRRAVTGGHIERYADQTGDIRFRRHQPRLTPGARSSPPTGPVSWCNWTPLAESRDAWTDPHVTGGAPGHLATARSGGTVAYDRGPAGCWSEFIYTGGPGIAGNGARPAFSPDGSQVAVVAGRACLDRTASSSMRSLAAVPGNGRSIHNGAPELYT